QRQPVGRGPGHLPRAAPATHAAPLHVPFPVYSRDYRLDHLARAQRSRRTADTARPRARQCRGPVAPALQTESPRERRHLVRGGGLRASLDGKAQERVNELALLWVLNLSDGGHDLLDIAERSGLAFGSIRRAADLLRAHGLLISKPRAFGQCARRSRACTPSSPARAVGSAGRSPWSWRAAAPASGSSRATRRPWRPRRRRRVAPAGTPV